MNREKNKAALKRALAQLPEYEPAAEVWTGIAESLDREANTAAMQSALRGLPTYEAPPSVWESIERELEGSARPKPNRRHLRPLFSWTGAAATLALLLIGLAWIYRSSSATVKEEIVFSEEQIEEARFVNDWDTEEDAFQLVLRELTERPYLKNNETLKRLREELEELNAAKSEVKSMMDTYGQDAELIREISDIERERTEVIKELASAF